MGNCTGGERKIEAKVARQMECPERIRAIDHGISLEDIEEAIHTFDSFANKQGGRQAVVERVIKYACTGPDADEPVDTELSYALFSVTLQSENATAVVTTHQIIEAMKKTKLFQKPTPDKDKSKDDLETPYTLAYGPSGSLKVLNTFWKPKYQEFGRDSRNLSGVKNMKKAPW